jgi:hypothetical protein
MVILYEIYTNSGTKKKEQFIAFVFYVLHFYMLYRKLKSCVNERQQVHSHFILHLVSSDHA